MKEKKGCVVQLRWQDSGEEEKEKRSDESVMSGEDWEASTSTTVLISDPLFVLLSMF